HYHKLFEFTGSGSWDSQLPYGKLYHFRFITVINGDHSLLFVCKSAIADLLVIVSQELYRASQQLIIFFMDPDNILMEIDQLLILSPPGVSPSVIRICEAAESCFVSIVDSRCSRPGHLDHYCFPEYSFINALFSRFATQIFYPAYLMIGPGKETGMVVVRQLIHSSHQRRSVKAGHMILHRTDKT